MKQILTIVVLSVFVQIGSAQIVRNGDFEINILEECAYNLKNKSFDSTMPYCYAFGSAEELDVQDSLTCPTYSLPSHGRWFISIHTQETGLVDALSLLLYPPLVAGRNYQLTYFEKTEIEIDFINSLDSLLIGVSNDSLSFGSQIYASQPFHQPGWTLKTFSFTSPANASYLSFTNQGKHKGWNFIDNIRIDSITAIYTFTGTGNWTDPANWSNNLPPPAILNAGSKIIIDPIAGGQCVLNINFIMPGGTILTVNPGKTFFLEGNLELNNTTPL